MSYAIYLTDPVNGEVLELGSPHNMKGGTGAMGFAGRRCGIVDD